MSQPSLRPRDATPTIAVPRPTPTVLPFLKWPGGKRNFVNAIKRAAGAHHRRYLEPFLGGGAVFFGLGPPSAVLSDVNEELINAFVCVRDDVELIIRRLSRMQISEETYYRVRAERPHSALARAIRFLYLNRTAFNGMYRVNRTGDFNVPFGCKPGTVLCPRELLRAAAIALRAADIVASDFEPIVATAGAGDLVYLDPPYTTAHDKNGFRRYNDRIFSWSDQERLATAAAAAVRRGATVIVSNANHNDVFALYPNFEILVLTRASCIAAAAAARKPVHEVLLVSSR